MKSLSWRPHTAFTRKVTQRRLNTHTMTGTRTRARYWHGYWARDYTQDATLRKYMWMGDGGEGMHRQERKNSTNTQGRIHERKVRQILGQNQTQKVTKGRIDTRRKTDTRKKTDTEKRRQRYNFQTHRDRHTQTDGRTHQQTSRSMRQSERGGGLCHLEEPRFSCQSKPLRSAGHALWLHYASAHAWPHDLIRGTHACTCSEDKDLRPHE